MTDTPLNFSRRFSVAPMMDWSDRHCRHLWRIISRHAFLYSEMVTTGALIHGDSERFLRYHEAEHPLALQLGGSDPKDLATCSKMAEEWGYDEVNLNCGCPSDRVQNGMIGAILMGHPELVADCIKSMQDAVSIDVTVKHRIGIDDMEDYPGLCNFVETVAKTGCKTFVVHARKAWLQGLSPKENREIPPLQYGMVHQLKQDYPELEIIINGGITTMEQCESHLVQSDQYGVALDGVMVGREAYTNPYVLAEVDQRLYDDAHAIPSRTDVAREFIEYCREEMARGTQLKHMSRHVLGLFQGVKGAKQFRRHISENAYKADASISILEDALAKVDESKRYD
jgi:tRNA-dihydrouridine synthase A